MKTTDMRVKTFALVGFGGSFDRLHVTLYYTLTAAIDATYQFHQDMPIAIWHKRRGKLVCKYALRGARKHPNLCADGIFEATSGGKL